MTRLVSGRNLFTLFIIVVFGGALFMATDWPLRASIIVLVLGTLGIGLGALQLVLDLRKTAEEERDTPRPTYETPSFEAEDPRLNSLATYETWAWLVGLVVAIFIIGLPLALIAFVFLYCKTHGGGWLLSLFLTSGIAAFIYGIYVQIMHVYWPRSLLGEVLLPWVEI
ncbi:MAG: hypothetical protein GEU76_04375 [Alphaproteobacteria bacterium]|nr:hypothetical protein [Alphaproteobacteria bacterium]